MKPSEALSEVEPGDTIKTDTHEQDFTVKETMFGGEMADIEGPEGGEKSLVENVNSGRVRILSGGDTLGEVNDIEL